MAKGLTRAPVRVLVVDESFIFRAGLKCALEADGGFTVVGTLGDAEEARHAARASEPDVAIVDAHLPDESGIALCRHLTTAHGELAVLVLASFDWDIYLAAAWAAGATGFLLKSTPIRHLIDGLRWALARPLYTPEQLSRVYAWERNVGERLALLAPRERHILRLVATGRTNRDIAETLMLSENTVEKHVGALLKKVGAQSRTALLAFILRNHLDVLSEPYGQR